MKYKIQNKVKQTHRYRRQTVSSQRGERLGSWVKRVKGLSKIKNNSDTDNSTVITRGEGGR